MKLNQVIAVEKGIKSKAHEVISEDLKALKKPDLFSGVTRIYRKVDDNDIDLPPERKRVQLTVKGVLNHVALAWSDLMNITAKKDWTNCSASADVVIDGKILLAGVPVPHLLFLEKQATDIRTLMEALPILDEAESWNDDDVLGLKKSEILSTHKTKKLENHIIVVPATDKFPAQTALKTEDRIVGFWDAIKFSGAITKPERDILVQRAEKLVNALKIAREAANNTDVVVTPLVGKEIFQYVLGE